MLGSSRLVSCFIRKQADVPELGFLNITTRCHCVVRMKPIEWPENLGKKLYSPEGCKCRKLRERILQCFSMKRVLLQ